MEEFNDTLSIIMHEIRSPINTIIGLLAHAKNSLDNKCELEKQLNNIQSMCNYILNICNMELFLKKNMQEKNSNRHLFLLSDLMEEIETIFSFQASLKQICFSVQKQYASDIKLDGDEISIKQILMNLLSNSIKYTDEKGEVVFSAVAEYEGETAQLSFTVADNGIGMNQEFLKKIFIPFSQENSINSERGTGLGMTIVRQLIHDLGGDIDIQSEKGKGTVVKIRLDLSIGAKDFESFNFSGKRILIADDCPINSGILSDCLESVHFSVDTVKDGQAAFNQFRNSEEYFYDMIILDMRMPALDGWETSKLIRSLQRSDAKEVPIIAYSAHLAEEEISRVLSCGMTDYLLKPVKAQRLYHMMQKHLK